MNGFPLCLQTFEKCLKDKTSLDMYGWSLWGLDYFYTSPRVVIQ